MFHWRGIVVYVMHVMLSSGKNLKMYREATDPGRGGWGTSMRTLSKFVSSLSFVDPTIDPRRMRLR